MEMEKDILGKRLKRVLIEDEDGKVVYDGDPIIVHICINDGDKMIICSSAQMEKLKSFASFRIGEELEESGRRYKHGALLLALKESMGDKKTEEDGDGK